MTSNPSPRLMQQDILALVTITQGDEHDMLVRAFPAGQETDAKTWAFEKLVELRSRFDPFKGEIRVTIRLHKADTKAPEQEYSF